MSGQAPTTAFLDRSPSRGFRLPQVELLRDREVLDAQARPRTCVPHGVDGCLRSVCQTMAEKVIRATSVCFGTRSQRANRRTLPRVAVQQAR